MIDIFSDLQSEFNKALFNTQANRYFEPLVEKYFPEKSLVNIKAKVISTKLESKDIKTITLKPNKKWGTFTPGQYVEIGLKINAVNYYRNFSISSTLEQFQKEGTISITIQKQEKGKVTSWIFDYLTSDTFVTISPAKGTFTNNDNEQPALFIAGGTGITPFISLLDACAKDNKDAVLMYYAKTGNHIFCDKLKAIAQINNIKVHIISTTEEGRISVKQLQNLCPDFSQRKVFVCGPNKMIEDTQSLFGKMGYNQENIVFEYFKAAAIATNLPNDNTQATIQLKDKILSVQGNVSILEQLEANNISAKYGCRMGLCKQCQCTKNSGIVFNKLTGKFSESTEEVIQICVSIPVGEVSIQL